MLKSGLLALILLTLPIPFTTASAQSAYPFVAKDFDVPATLETDSFRLRMLTVSDVVKDYDAVMTSKPYLLDMFEDWGGWPEGLTLEDNLIDLGWHQKEFMRRTSFTYTVVSLDDARVLGCVYIFPTRKQGYDANITFWARESAEDDPADKALGAAVRAWIESEWPFEAPAYPGRDIPIDEWEALPELAR